MSKDAIILLSGGLDSLVSLDIAIKKLDVKLALIFDYGQSAYFEEKQAAIDIAKYYNISLKFIDLSFMRELCDFQNKNFDDFDSVWIPNRNGLFLNIAASFCDKYNYGYIIFGANKEESCQFPDNSGAAVCPSPKKQPRPSSKGDSKSPTIVHSPQDSVLCTWGS